MAATPILTRRPEVIFQTTGAPPPGALYISPDEVLLLQVANSFSGLSVDISGRLLLVTGEVVPFQFRVLPDATRTNNQTLHRLSEGYLLSVAVQSSGAGEQPGQAWCRLLIGHGGLTTFLTRSALLEGWLTNLYSLAWPSIIANISGSGGGFDRVVVGTDPAAGVEISETVPTNALWRLQSIRFELVASGAAANRQVHLLLDDGTNVYFRQPAVSVTTAGQTMGYTFAPVGAAQTAVDLHQVNLLPGPIYLPDVHRIRTVTTDLQAGDNFSAPLLFVEEWILL